MTAWEAITQFALEITRAYNDDNIDECEINRIERVLKDRCKDDARIVQGSCEDAADI